MKLTTNKPILVFSLGLFASAALYCLTLALMFLLGIEEEASIIPKAALHDFTTFLQFTEYICFVGLGISFLFLGIRERARNIEKTEVIKRLEGQNADIRESYKNAVKELEGLRTQVRRIALEHGKETMEVASCVLVPNTRYLEVERYKEGVAFFGSQVAIITFSDGTVARRVVSDKYPDDFNALSAYKEEDAIDSLESVGKAKEILAKFKRHGEFKTKRDTGSSKQRGTRRRHSWHNAGKDLPSVSQRRRETTSSKWPRQGPRTPQARKTRAKMKRMTQNHDKIPCQGDSRLAKPQRDVALATGGILVVALLAELMRWDELTSWTAHLAGMGAILGNLLAIGGAVRRRDLLFQRGWQKYHASPRLGKGFPMIATKEELEMRADTLLGTLTDLLIGFLYFSLLTYVCLKVYLDLQDASLTMEIYIVLLTAVFHMHFLLISHRQRKALERIIGRKI